MRSKETTSTASSVLVPRGLRIAQAAAYIGCSPWFMEEAVRSGRLKGAKLGRHWVIFIEDLNAFIERTKKLEMK